jgi:hypothetical protein
MCYTYQKGVNMTKFLLINFTDTQRFIKDFDSEHDAKQYVINHLDLSKQWNIFKW